jgi:hypothetical protein
VHDPPARALSRTDVYGLDLYSELRRVLTNDGTLFHYIGNPDSKESGRLYRGIAARLQEAGFVDVKKAVRVFGLVAKASGRGSSSGGGAGKGSSSGGSGSGSGSGRPRLLRRKRSGDVDPGETEDDL